MDIDVYSPVSLCSPSVSSTSPPSKPLTRSSSCPAFSPSSTLPSLCLPTSLSHSSPNITFSWSPPAPQPPALDTPLPPSTSESQGEPITISFPSNIQSLGFPNIGNTCYMNATLQALLGLSSFTSDLLRHRHCWESPSSALLLRNMGDLQLVRQNTTQTYKKRPMLKNIRRSISTICPEFSGDHQQDAHEFLVFCLMKLKEERASISHLQLTCRCPVENMEFQLLSVYTCNCCGVTFDRKEQYNHLSISASDQDSLHNSMDHFFKTTEVEYTCRVCSGRQASLKLYFVTQPRVLVLHLKRFGDISGTTKSSNPINIPLQLNLSRYNRGVSMGQLIPSNSTSCEELQDSVEQPDISLQAAPGLPTPLLPGHYICDVLEGDGSNWLCFNDDMVSRENTDILQERSSTAYLLFYVQSRKLQIHPLYREVVFVQRLYEPLSLWYTFGGGSRFDVGSDTSPKLTVLPPHTSASSATLMCLANGGFPSDWTLSWSVAGSSRSGETSLWGPQKDGLYSWSSTLTLPLQEWTQDVPVTCQATRGSQTVTKILNKLDCS
ncbi:hypothetical protein ACEWY4_001642 [Coilia grayii]|uniref:Ubiquitin carboxyl-terminal hydrolase n=1 Tax=Coilia grayii TaxID=363190 RepID=A0ABD1KTH2_9TELE